MIQLHFKHLKSWLQRRPFLTPLHHALAVFALVLLTNVPLQVDSSVNVDDADFISKKEEKIWVDSVYNSLTLEERIGQLIFIRAYSNKDESHARAVERLIKEYKVGGMTFFQGTPDKQAELTNRYQKLADKLPLLVSIDGEWGLGMRMKETTISYPRQLMLGAIQDNALIYDFGKEVARQCRRIGVHINFAPVVDVNNNPNNPVINDRSFGEDRYNVATKSYMYMKGMQDFGLLACAKHFPGHGDTDVDSHYDLPVIPHTKARLDSIELYPFEVLAQHGVGSMMIAHLNIPVLDNTDRLPSSLSGKIVTDLLRNDLGYQGLVFTDGLEMAGARKAFKGGEVEAQALLAGNDVLLLPQNVPDAVEAVKKSYEDGRLTKLDLQKKVKRVLKQKYQLGLTQPQQVELANIRTELNSSSALALKRKLIENAITAVRNKNDLMPLVRLEGAKYTSISIGKGYKTDFQKALDFYSPMEHLTLEKSFSRSHKKALVNNLKNQDAVIVSFHNMSKSPKDGFNISDVAKEFVQELAQVTPVIVVVFGSPYSLKYFDEIGCLVESYDEDPMTQEVTAQALFGSSRMTGRLPVTASTKAQFGDGVNTMTALRLGTDLPENVGMNSDTLQKIDAIAAQAIAAGATPGCQILIAKDGKIVYYKAFGQHTYDHHSPFVQTDDLYDLASVTKICATTAAMMKLVDEGKVSLDEPLGLYLPELKGTNKENLLVKDVMAHQARLIPWIPFYQETLEGSRRKRPSNALYKKSKSEDFSTPVADELFIKNTYPQTIWQKIINTELRPTAGYKYSDLGFYISGKIVETVSGQPLDEFVKKNFYAPMGLHSIGFNPLQHFSKSQIPPTEKDSYFRMQTVQGYVHDMGAAMMGGVSGHAGLFSNAKDVAAMMQLWLNDGFYGGVQYLKPATVERFITRHPESTRRGIGFDMKELDNSKPKSCSPRASENAFGHLGFTGICTWADPDYNLVYVFLSNRTYPSMENEKLQNLDFRPRIQSVIYQALL